MATSVGLNFRLTAAVDKFEASMKGVERRLESIDRSSRQTAGGMKLLAAIEIGKSVLSSITGLFNVFRGGVSTINQFVSSASDTADAIGKLSSSTGMAHEPLQVFQQLATYNGVSSDKLGEAVKRMTKRLAEAKMGFGEALPALQRLNLNVDELANMRPEQAFLKIGAAIGQLPQKGDQAAAAFKIFSDQGLAMVPMFENLEANVRATAEEMLELGQVLGENQIKNIEAMNDSFAKVKATAHGLLTQVLANFAPALTKANEMVTEMIKNFVYDGKEGGQALALMITDALFTGADVLLSWVETASNVFLTISSGLFKVAEMFLNFAALLAEWADTFYAMFAPLMRSLTGSIEIDPETIASMRRLAQSAGDTSEALWNTEADLSKARDGLAAMRQAARDNAATMADMDPILDGIGDAAAAARDPLELFGRENGLAGDALRQLATDAEAYGENHELARQALDGMKDAAKNATPAADLFGKNVGTSADELAAMARIQEDYSDNLRRAEDALDGLADSGVISNRQLEDLAKIVAESGGIHSELGQKLLAVADSAGKLDDVQKSLQRSMMKPAEDFANQRAEMLKRMGFNPFFVESQKEQWLAQQQEAVNKQIEIQREAYEKFLERTGQGAGTAIKEALKETLDVDAEDTLPELKTQTATLGDILEAVKKQVFTQVVIP